ncbi:MAG: hypothetical protein ACT4OM_05025 [Actinomycetota bacterium]
MKKTVALVVGLALGALIAGRAARRKKSELAPEGVWKDAAPGLNGSTSSQV